jgi:transglutaminase-like putative cysteine protease
MKKESVFVGISLISLSRCMNIPARYVNGDLGHIGVPRNAAPMDFNT